MPIPGADFVPARDIHAREPAPASLGFGGLAGAPGTLPSRALAGIELESEMPMPFAPIVQGGAIVGTTLRSAYSPALRRAIALAQIAPALAAPCTAVAIRRLTPSGIEEMPARVTALPFLKFIA